MKYKYTKIQKVASAWLTFFTILCFVNSVLVIKYECWNWNSYSLAFLLPFAHLGLIVVIGMVYGAYVRFFTYGKLTDPDNEYIKCHYPHIWKRLHPWSDEMLSNSFAYIPFIRGMYDDGTDERLNEIKFKAKVYSNIICWPFFLTIVVWIFSFVLMGWYGRFAQ